MRQWYILSQCLPRVNKSHDCRHYPWWRCKDQCNLATDEILFYFGHPSRQAYSGTETQSRRQRWEERIEGQRRDFSRERDCQPPDFAVTESQPEAMSVPGHIIHLPHRLLDDFCILLSRNRNPLCLRFVVDVDPAVFNHPAYCELALQRREPARCRREVGQNEDGGEGDCDRQRAFNVEEPPGSSSAMAARRCKSN